MAFLSSRISPRVSTVIFWERSPLAMAVETSAMLRTWAVRLPASRFTSSTRILPGAGEPSTLRLAAELALDAHLANDARDAGRDRAQPAHHRLTVVREFAESLPAGALRSCASDMSRERSPFATSPRTVVASVTGQAIGSMSELTESTASAHEPRGAERRALRRLPFEPTARSTRAELVDERLVLLDEGVEGERDLAHHAVVRSIGGEADARSLPAWPPEERPVERGDAPRGARGNLSCACASEREHKQDARSFRVHGHSSVPCSFLPFRLPDALPACERALRPRSARTSQWCLRKMSLA